MNKRCRLLITGNCPNNCPLCCNKQFNLKNIPVLDRLDYDEYIFTGGEPLLYLNELKNLMNTIINAYRFMGKEYKFYLYTSICTPSLWNDVIWKLDGITYTVHTPANARELIQLIHTLRNYNNGYEQIFPELQKIKNCSVWLNLFPEGKDFIDEELAKSPFSWNDISEYFKIRPMEWVENCPVPEGEDFRRLSYLY